MNVSSSVYNAVRQCLTDKVDEDVAGKVICPAETQMNHCMIQKKHAAKVIWVSDE